MLGSLRVKPESSYRQPIDPPQDLIAPPRQEKRRDLEGRGVVYLKMILLFFFFTRRSLRCHDTERGGKSLLWYCHGIVRGKPRMTGGVYSYKRASTEACSSVDRCPMRYAVRQKDSHRLLFTRAWQTNSSRLVGGWEQSWENLFVLPVCFPGRDVATWAVLLLWGGKKLSILKSVDTRQLTVYTFNQNWLRFDQLLFFY